MSNKGKKSLVPTITQAVAELSTSQTKEEDDGFGVFEKKEPAAELADSQELKVEEEKRK